MSTTREPFESECYYHVFNHARGIDNLFDSDKEYRIFMVLISKYIIDIAHIYSYCLMPNHFHFLIRIKEFELPENFKEKGISDFVSHQWGNVQNTYTKKKNYRSGNKGGLFCQSINRNLISSENYLQMAIVYIHNNPVKHGFCNLPNDWKYSSYNSIISDKSTQVERDEVLEWFENMRNFKDYHQTNADDIFAEKYGMD
jgi:putative transposase